MKASKDGILHLLQFNSSTIHWFWNYFSIFQINCNEADVEISTPVTKKPLLDTKNSPLTYSCDEIPISRGPVEDMLVYQSILLKAICRKLFEGDNERYLACKWRQLAIVLDRIFFIITTALVVCASLAILLKKPPYDESDLFPNTTNTSLSWRPF